MNCNLKPKGNVIDNDVISHIEECMLLTIYYVMRQKYRFGETRLDRLTKGMLHHIDNACVAAGGHILHGMCEYLNHKMKLEGMEYGLRTLRDERRDTAEAQDVYCMAAQMVLRKEFKWSKLHILEAVKAFSDHVKRLNVTLTQKSAKPMISPEAAAQLAKFGRTVPDESTFEKKQTNFKEVLIPELEGAGLDRIFIDCQIMKVRNRVMV